LGAEKDTEDVGRKRRAGENRTKRGFKICSAHKMLLGGNKSRTIRWARRVACMEQRKRIPVSGRKREGKGHLKDLGVDGKILIKRSRG